MKALYDLPAPAKLNLFLHVIGRRDDGYHLLQSALVLIDWCDTLHIERRDDGQLARHDLGDVLPPDDLCLRAAALLQRESGTPFGADISIDKRLPSGAGMGGGSSDAATTLLALNRLWGLGWPRSRLQALALRLGADVPFFVGGENAFVEGIGERLTPIALPRQWLAVVKPAAGVATREIFASPLLRRDTEAAIISGFLADASTARGFGAGSFGRNDLQPPAMSRCGGIGEAARWLETRFGHSRMTGSGSAVFAGAGTGAQPTFPLPEDPAPGTVSRMCRSLERHPLRDFADG
ncbi:MAG TPA: 4-(cytidine 5'-diphospho)-2-C-methyl-D-erythritol kinase [Burkholderiaceae bacterium]|nr:4-(cytidine 5'-diphospho)-2-C-methyl-D-erythritol kinase [Burkholderiaceae bacterium]